MNTDIKKGDRIRYTGEGEVTDAWGPSGRYIEVRDGSGYHSRFDTAPVTVSVEVLERPVPAREYTPGDVVKLLSNQTLVKTLGGWRGLYSGRLYTSPDLDGATLILHQGKAVSQG